MRSRFSFAESTVSFVCFRSAWFLVREMRWASTLFPRSVWLTCSAFVSAWSMSTCPPTASSVCCSLVRKPSFLRRCSVMLSLATCRPSRRVVLSPTRRSRSLNSPEWSSLYALKRSWSRFRPAFRPSMASTCAFMAVAASKPPFCELWEASALSPYSDESGFISLNFSSMFRMASKMVLMSICAVPSRPSMLSECSCCLVCSEIRTPCFFSVWCVSLCRPWWLSAVDRARSLMSFIMSMCRAFRPSASSLVRAAFSASSAIDRPIFVAPECSDLTSPSRSSDFCCSCFSRVFVERMLVAILERSVFVASWSAPSLSLSRFASPKSFCSFSMLESVCASFLTREWISSCCWS
mmetsp:Transcript_96035/g.299957  ORF Transcript_96035/g.299957 Transcript_96035/m.299957 type:complete len:351 (+) Transcript_96035:480-1532(+)